MSAILRRSLLVAAIVGIGASAAVAQSTAPPPASQEKEGGKPAPSPVGKWTLTAEVPNNTMVSTLDLKTDPKDAKKVVGTMVGQAGEIAVQGEFVEQKLTFWISFPTNNGNLDVSFRGAFRQDGSLAGTLDYGQGAVNWYAVRVKEK
jgi:hypothetical protein